MIKQFHGQQVLLKLEVCFNLQTLFENEYLRVEMNPNGTFNLTDKILGHVFQNLNYYEDRGEHGDYWLNKKPMFDRVITSLGCHAVISVKESGPLRSTLVSEIRMPLPSKGIREQQKRGDNIIDMLIRTEITLCAGSKQLEVNVEFENRHEDHCLRVMFPTLLNLANMLIREANSVSIKDLLNHRALLQKVFGLTWQRCPKTIL